MPSLVEQVRRAREGRGLSVAQLLERSGLRLERSTLARKLAGAVPTTTEECEAMARALDVTLVVLPVVSPPKKKARRAK